MKLANLSSPMALPVSDIDFLIDEKASSSLYSISIYAFFMF
jgi:hypothetical protein